MRDFTLNIYKTLLNTLLSNEVEFQSFYDFIENPGKISYIFRHDVERFPENSLIFAKIQSELGIKGTYYFRIVPQSFNPTIIKEIASLGHEIGYHYETMATSKGNIDKAYDEFCRNLEKFRKLVPVSTICMHGSPLSKYDNRDIWKKYDYHKLGIAGEPYFDIDYNKVLYLTDTGRRWDGERFSVRDKIVDNHQSSVTNHQPIITNNQSPTTNHQSPTTNHQKFHSTYDIIRAAESGELPDKIMFTFHPQRWCDALVPWIWELVWQGVKNRGKVILTRLRD